MRTCGSMAFNKDSAYGIKDFNSYPRLLAAILGVGLVVAFDDVIVSSKSCHIQGRRYQALF